MFQPERKTDWNAVAPVTSPVSTRLVTGTTNLPWLRAMETAIETVRNRYALDSSASGTTLLLALRDAAQANLESVYASNHEALPHLQSYLFGEPNHVGGFGERRCPRVAGDQQAIHRTHFSTKYSRHESELRSAIDTFGCDDFLPLMPTPFEEVGRGYAATYTLDGREIRLTEVFLSREQGRLRGEWSPMMRCIHMRQIDTALEILDREVKRAQEAIPESPLAHIELLGRVQWAASHAWPFERGSAALADMLTKLLGDMRGISFPGWSKATDPNIIALTTPDISVFAKRYPQLFALQAYP